MEQEILLQCLRETEGYLSGEELSRRLGVSRSAVWKAVARLRSEGYPIASAPRRGYRLDGPPDLLEKGTILAGLKTQTFGRSLSVFKSVDSTNEEAKRQAAQGAPHGAVFLAERQTGGKGRLGRHWDSPPGEGVWMSLLLRPAGPPAEASVLTLLAGLAVCNALRGECGCDAWIKWPNDIVAGGKKLCGILTEVAAEMDRIHWAVVGIGLNANQGAFPDEIAWKATSLRLETGRRVERSAVLRRILLELEEAYRLYYEERRPGFLEAYQARCISLGRRVRAERGGNPLEGEAVAVTAEGDLLLRCGNGRLEAVRSGEVSVQGIYGEPGPQAF